MKRLSLLIAAVAVMGCASSAPEVRSAPVVLAERCTTGPFCVTGEVDDQYATAVEGVRCAALGGGGQTAATDKRGVFLMDGLPALPPQIRFEKPGFVGQTLAVLPAATGIPARVYVILHHIGQSECTCEPSALISGREPCPDEVCGRVQADPIVPEATPTPPETPEK